MREHSGAGEAASHSRDRLTLFHDEKRSSEIALLLAQIASFEVALIDVGIRKLPRKQSIEFAAAILTPARSKNKK